MIMKSVNNANPNLKCLPNNQWLPSLRFYHQYIYPNVKSYSGNDGDGISIASTTPHQLKSTRHHAAVKPTTKSTAPHHSHDSNARQPNRSRPKAKRNSTASQQRQDSTAPQQSLSKSCSQNIQSPTMSIKLWTKNSMSIKIWTPKILVTFKNDL